MVAEQVDLLRHHGHRVSLIARRTDDYKGSTQYAMVAATRVATGYGASPAQELAALQPDVVHLHNTFPNFGTRWLERWGMKTVATLHNYRTVCSAGTLFRDGQECFECLGPSKLPAIRYGCYRGSRSQTLPLAIGATRVGGFRPILRHPKTLVALNDQMAEIIASYSGRPVTVIPNFVSDADASTAHSDSWAFVGRLTEEKGLVDLLANWPPGRQLHIYGDGPLRPLLQSQHSAETGVHWHGLANRVDLLKTLGRFTGLIVPSLWSEGLPTVILESLARSVPIVISTRVAAAPALIAAGVAVPMSVGPIARDGLIDALNQVQGRGDQMRRQCRVYHRNTFSSQAWLDAITAVYDKLG
ncbi:glycosyltransferase family 4 protein [Nocardioides sp.]|uniref:glycosyltransferase family 4 protein n=1 Tax=Nocardioides sp. TaxID=35761 RepID=UPI00351E881A